MTATTVVNGSQRPGVRVNALGGVKSAFDPSNFVPVMDANGIWTQRPINTLPHLPYAIRLTISPQVAAKILAERNISNRPMLQRQVDRYTNDILQGHWHLHGNGIQFDRDGKCIDGQHRLAAVVEAGQSVDFMVTFGVEPMAVAAIDEGRRRSNFDVATMIGMEGFTKLGLSAASYLLEETGKKSNMSRMEVLKFAENHRDAIHFVSDRFHMRGMTKAPVLSALVRAYYHCRTNQASLNRLTYFIDLLQKSTADLAGTNIPLEDNAPLVLKSFMDRSAGKNTGGFRKELYDKAKAAIWNFFKGIPITKLYGYEEQIFLLPEER